MPAVLDDLPQLIRDYEAARRGEAEQSGRLKEAARRMKDELGVDNETTAERLVRKLRRRRDRLTTAYLTGYRRFAAAFQAYQNSLREDE